MSVNKQNITGQVTIDQYTLYSDDVIADDAAFTLVSATLALAGDDLFAATSFSGDGQVRSLDAAELNGVSVLDDALFVNVGAASQTGGLTVDGSVRNIGAWTLAADEQIVGASPGATFTNVGSFDALGGGVISTDFIDRGQLTIAGTLELLGASDLINVGGLPAYGNTGTIEIGAGTARFNQATAPTRFGLVILPSIKKLLVSGGASAHFLVDAATQIDSIGIGALDLASGAAVVINPGATVELENPLGSTISGTVRGAGTFYASAEIAVTDGARLLSRSTIGQIDVSGRVVAGSASLPFAVGHVELDGGRLVWLGGVIGDDIVQSISGDGVVANVGVLQLFGAFPNSVVGSGVTIVNTRELDLGGYGGVDMALDPGAKIVNRAGANMSWEAGDLFKLTGGEIVNDGAVAMWSMTRPPDAKVYATADISTLVQNDGTIASGAGIEFEDAVNGTGSIDVTVVNFKGTPLTGVQGQGVTFDAAIGAGQHVVFTGPDQRLTLNDVSGFQGAVFGFDASGSGDEIVVDTSVWSFAGYSQTAGALEFASNGAETAVSLSGDYAASGFQATVSGTKTTLTYTPPA